MLPAGPAHHVAHVLRLREGDRLDVFDGAGSEFAAVIASIGKRAVRARLERACAASRESPLAVTLVQGVSRGERMDYTVQKAVELGVARICPVLTRRGVVRLDATRAPQRLEHWRAVAVGACEQCGRNRLPDIAPPVDYDAWIARLRSSGVAGTLVLLDPAAAIRLRDLPAPAGTATLLAGPEGGLTAAERAAALSAGFVAVRLGPRVLRTETAALAALAAMQALWGDF